MSLYRKRILILGFLNILYPKENAGLIFVLFGAGSPIKVLSLTKVERIFPFASKLFFEYCMASTERFEYRVGVG